MRKIIFFTLIILFCFALPAFAETRLLLHCEGVQNSTTITDSAGNHTPVSRNTAKIDNNVSKWGDGSLVFGALAYVAIPDSDDWGFFASVSTTHTVDFWAKDQDTDFPQSDDGYFGQHINTNNNYSFVKEWNNDYLHTTFWSNYVRRMYISSTPLTWADDNWHHYALVFINGVVGVYVDGAQVDYGTWGGSQDFAAEFFIGTTNLFGAPPPSVPAAAYHGWIDEFRVTDSNDFGAVPVAGLTDTITVPTEAYDDPVLAGGSQPIVVAMLD